MFKNGKIHQSKYKGEYALPNRQPKRDTQTKYLIFYSFVLFGLFPVVNGKQVNSEKHVRNWVSWACVLCGPFLFGLYGAFCLVVNTHLSMCRLSAAKGLPKKSENANGKNFVRILTAQNCEKYIFFPSRELLFIFYFFACIMMQMLSGKKSTYDYCLNFVILLLERRNLTFFSSIFTCKKVEKCFFFYT